ncbi:MAG: putative membrane protein [uncultured Rubrobacteraceae bacterium]|uniref:Putative membrane protein n=1 Tax=uncultured Rubrobacteraceae bacterium TaxID=349277 RepID=A0A6J4RIA4_9ACTN|nr:MAG: putative membrane protein [uncultured Rubrobacteraceae bacterium]
MGNKRSGQVRTTASSGGSRKTYIIVGAVVLAFVAGFIALVVIDSRQQAASTPPGEVQTYDVGPANEHTQGDVEYDQTPPTGGEHNPVWQNSGFYEDPVRDENAVHTLEHGAVWITYAPDLPQDQKDQIRELVEGQTCMLASPHEDLPTPVVASAWGKQLTLESADSPDLQRFVRAYRQGPQTQEPGASCTGGTADTV